MRNAASENLELPGSMLRIAPERQRPANPAFPLRGKTLYGAARFAVDEGV
jgi:hypothetical protein